MVHRFYVNCALEPGAVEIQGPEAHHLGSVCRVRPGDLICLFNGDGYEYPAQVLEVSRRGIGVQVTARETAARELGYRLEVAAPLPKGDRGQFLVEKLTELGVTHYVPLRTRRSIVHPGEARLDKLQRHVIEASKQCGRNVLLHVTPTTDWDAYCQQSHLPAMRFLAHPAQATTREADFERQGGADVAVAVGPEGGFTDEEIERGLAQGWRLAGLGPRILRVETAALVLAAWGAGCRPA